MKTISIMNVKGGVGKTVTAVNLAQILAGDHHKRVLLIDADAQGDASYLLTPDYEDGSGLYGCLVLGGPYEDCVSPTRYRDLDIITGGSDLFYVSMESAERMTGAMGDLLEGLRIDGEYDYVIIDCPPSFSAPSVAAICSSDQVIIPVKLDALGIRGCRFLQDQIEAVHEYNPALELPRVLVTMWHNVEVCRDAVELLRENGFNLYDTRIRRTDKVDEATFFGQAMSEYSPRSAAGMDYRQLAEEILYREGGEDRGV